MFDQSTRNRLQKFVAEARSLLAGEFARQFRQDYGMDPATGEVSAIEALRHLDSARLETARLLRDTLEHYRAGSPSGSAREALDRMVREQAFTVLNRLCALRMAEARGILTESVGNAYQSKGFLLYTRLAGAALGDTYGAYRCYLFSVFDELALDLAVLFDRYAPTGRLFPRESALMELLTKINHPDLETLWAQDETIGWIYQYFNSQEERRQMRAESQAPRNSRELAVRNQFFTPRYVVEFLTDNTLGRIWYEMTQGQTALVHSCRYLVRRPTEIFLAPGEQAPEQPAETRTDLSQEELLQQPVYIPHRPLKDPRTLRMLDPACGSMHFGLYAFDLYERIYLEAWALEETHALEREEAGMTSLRAAYGNDYEAFRRDVPRLILEYNIHGIDIDPRAAQIAGLSLWLRAQRAWLEQGVPAAARPRIERSNVVCAEPMPGDKELLREFAAGLQPAVLGQLVEQIFEKMELAGEAGSLLKIEEEIAGAVEKARQAFEHEMKVGRQGKLFAEPQQAAFDFSGLGRRTQFWEQAEERILDALRNYAEQAEGHTRRRLFARDAARGFAFIDVCRKRYDVVLMNPPFGAASAGWKSLFEKAYPRTKNDLYAAFVERGIKVLQPFGMLGAITSRTGFFLLTFQYWRQELLLRDAHVNLLADLGYGVLDNALVETAAYCLTQGAGQSDCVFLPVLGVDIEIKSEWLRESVSNLKGLVLVDTQSFSLLPASPFAYWIPNSVFRVFSELPSLRTNWGELVRGPEVFDLEESVRIWTEVDPRMIGSSKRWCYYAKGGEFRRFASDVHLVVEYGPIRAGLKSFRRPGDEKYYFAPGVTYTQRTTSAFSGRILPRGCLTSPKGPAIIPDGKPAMWFALLAIANSSCFRQLIEIRVGAAEGAARSYDLNILREIAVPVPDVVLETEMCQLAQDSTAALRHLDSANETNHVFHLPDLLQDNGVTLAERTISFLVRRAHTDARLTANQRKINDIAFKLYGIEGYDRQAIEKSMGSGESHDDQGDVFHGEEEGEEEASANTAALVVSLLSFFIGCPLARWDIRYATGAKPIPELPDPFAPLPACPPGMLQNAQGLPAAPEDVPADYPLRLTWGGILVDDEGHAEDVVGRVREALAVIWGERAGDIEQEACDILGVKTLREYFRAPGKFFAEHLKRYSKSRRQAPIYWPLGTPSGSYTLWLYYHRLSDQTLYTAVNDFVEPKIRQVEQQIAALRARSGRSKAEEKELENLLSLDQELRGLRDELLRVAASWKPNLNDGVVITAAPLWRLFQHKPWQKTLKETWQKLEKGDYDWAHLAYSIWPERVVQAARKDRSIAIAHDLEEALWVKTVDGKGKEKWVAREDGDIQLKQTNA